MTPSAPVSAIARLDKKPGRLRRFFSWFFEMFLAPEPEETPHDYALFLFEKGVKDLQAILQTRGLSNVCSNCRSLLYLDPDTNRVSCRCSRTEFMVLPSHW